MLVFDDLGVLGKLAIPSSLKFQTCKKSSLGPRDTVSRTEAAGVFFCTLEGCFSDRDPGQTKEDLGNLRVARYV
jgi:hypothetical protein